MTQIFRLDSNGRPFEFPTYFLESEEYARIISEINSCYYKYDGKAFAVHYSTDIIYDSYKYFFENHGYNDYNIVSKQPIYWKEQIWKIYIIH